MRRKLETFILSALFALTFSSAQAITIGVTPSTQTAGVGDPVSVAITVAGLDGASLSAFDLDVGFDAGVLDFVGAAFGDRLDLGLAESWKDVQLGAGAVSLSQLSFDTPQELTDLQPGEFTLATLTFQALVAGTSPLGLSASALGDASGDPLLADLSGGTVTVTRVDPTTVPEPGTLTLLGGGLAAFAAGVRRRTRR